MKVLAALAPNSSWLENAATHAFSCEYRNYRERSQCLFFVHPRPHRAQSRPNQQLT